MQDNNTMQLRDFRIKKDWTQQELADKLGVTQQAIGQYEKGRLPVDDVLKKIIALSKGKVTPNDWFNIQQLKEENHATKTS